MIEQIIDYLIYEKSFYMLLAVIAVFSVVYGISEENRKNSKFLLFFYIIKYFIILAIVASPLIIGVAVNAVQETAIKRYCEKIEPQSKICQAIKNVVNGETTFAYRDLSKDQINLIMIEVEKHEDRIKSIEIKKSK